MERNVITNQQTQTPEVRTSLEVVAPYDRQEAASIIVESSLIDIEQRYGARGETPLPYHNVEHTLDVVDAASRLADAAIAEGKIQGSEKELLVTAAGMHDWEHSLGNGLSEQRSADAAEERMRQAGLFTQSEIDRVKRMIMGTVVYFVDGVLHQSADPEDHLSMLLADADLATLGKNSTIYWDRAVRMLKETSGNPGPSDEEIANFAMTQAQFMKAHVFYTDEARKLFSNKDANIRFTEQMARHYATR